MCVYIYGDIYITKTSVVVQGVKSLLVMPVYPQLLYLKSKSLIWEGRR